MSSGSSFLEAKLTGTDVNALIADYEPIVGESQELRLLRDALRLSAHVLSKDRKQLASQLLGRLLGRREPGLNAVLEGAKSQPGSPWLRPRTGGLTQAGGGLIRTLEGHTAGVKAVAVVDGRRAASDDRTLRVWDLESGETLAAMMLDAPVSAVAATPDGKIVVAGDQAGRVHFFDLVESE